MKKAKFIILALLGLFTFFFSNNFGLIDVEKTSIITAIAIDKEDDEYLVSAQIAVPEATDTNAENQKTEISAKGKTVAEALKNTGDVTGWFPKLAFCNLIILGNNLSDTNVIKVLDYFAKTLRIQDSATVVLAQGKAQELLKKATPLDNISSFAIQKIILKNPGFDKEVCPVDVKTFCSCHYSISGSAYMPLVKVIKADASQDQGQKSDSSSQSSTQNSSAKSGSGGQDAGKTTKNQDLFDARTTALFKDGKKVGELSPELTVLFNAMQTNIDDSTLAVDDVQLNEQKCNFLLTIESAKSCIKLKPEGEVLNAIIDLSMFCKITDVNADGTDYTLSQNKPLPQQLIEKTEQMLTQRLNQLVEVSVSSGCDFLEIKQKLYRHHYGQYSKFKDDYLSRLKVKVNVDVYGQK